MPFIGDGHSKDLTPMDKSLTFDKLVEQLRDVLGPSSGLDSKEIKPEDIQNIMKAYQSHAEEWRRYALADPSRNYTRNLVDEGNGKSNLVCDGEDL